MSEIKCIRLYGILGSKFGKIHRLAVNSPKEAIRALCVIMPGFEKFLIRAGDRGITFSVFKGKRNLSEKEYEMSQGADDIRIAPIIIGSKKAGVFQTILGAVLVAASVFYGAYTGDWSNARYGTQAGAAMMLGGVVQMLSPQQGGLASRQDPDNKPSYAFGGPVNSIAQGNPVPILYGKRRIGGAIISAGIYAEDQS